MTKAKKTAIFICAAIVLVVSLPFIANAISKFFAKSDDHKVHIPKKDYFEIVFDDPFTNAAPLGPGESMAVNPVITSDATYDMYAFVKVHMPKCSMGGLYEVNTSWSIVDSYEEGGEWVEVYGYSDVLVPGQSTGLMADKVTMKNITKAEYAGLNTLDMGMVGYACDTEDQEQSTAWNSIKSSASY